MPEVLPHIVGVIILPSENSVAYSGTANLPQHSQSFRLAQYRRQLEHLEAFAYGDTAFYFIGQGTLQATSKSPWHAL
jgi:hypothetical protein